MSLDPAVNISSVLGLTEDPLSNPGRTWRLGNLGCGCQKANISAPYDIWNGLPGPSLESTYQAKEKMPLTTVSGSFKDH